MTPRPRIDWPAQTPPDDFADRVLAAALTEGVAVAHDEHAALGVGDLPPRTSVGPRARAGRGYIGWLVAAAFATMLLSGIVVVNKTQEAARQQALQAELITAKEEENKIHRQRMLEAQAKVDTLIDQLVTASTDAQRADLKRKIEEERQRQAALQSSARGAVGAASKARAPCKCQPGDPLCSCL
jgi:threonine dehydrogenase-like Zn-dependent dehydrogenase